jgi:protein-S-isoprenylcysteine O-methyltransferase Ste14
MIAAIFSRRFAANYLSTLGFVALSYWIISDLSSFHRAFLQGQWQLGMFKINYVLTVHKLIIWLIALYSVLLIPFYGAYPWLRSKAHVFLQGLWFSFLRLRRPPSRAKQAVAARQPFRLPWRVGLTTAAKQAALALLLKFFFAPLMLNWCLMHVADMSGRTLELISNLKDGMSGRALFDGSLFWTCFQLILFVDTFLFTIGYIVEIPALKNRIRTVDPTFFGWFICLACYPPFNGFTEQFFFEWQSTDFPRFETTTLHFIANISILVLMAIYSWASVSLGFKASNLTNRGIVSRGPYAFVRHPAYFTKNLAWWIGALPTLYLQYAMGNVRGFCYALFALTGWSTIYLLRAITEERHLLLTDNGYAQYVAKVRWRFIPGVI